MRYSASFITAIVISLALFLGMAALISQQPHKQTITFEMPSFNLVKEMPQPKINPTVRPILPEKQEPKPAPAAPSLAIKYNQTRPQDAIDMPTSRMPNIGMNPLAVPILTQTGFGTDGLYQNGDLACIACIQPNYPQKAAQMGIEGWVKVEFRVLSTKVCLVELILPRMCIST